MIIGRRGGQTLRHTLLVDLPAAVPGRQGAEAVVPLARHAREALGARGLHLDGFGADLLGHVGPEGSAGGDVAGRGGGGRPAELHEV